MKTKIVTAVVEITQQGEYQHFEVRIPDDVTSIDGVDSSCRFKTTILGLLNNDNLAQKVFEVCDLRLNGGKTNNWFYSESVSDYVGHDLKEKFYNQQEQCILPYTYHKKRDGNLCNVIPQGTRIKGYIKDIIGTNLETNIHYSITICIHLSTH